MKSLFLCIDPCMHFFAQKNIYNISIDACKVIQKLKRYVFLIYFYVRSRTKILKSKYIYVSTINKIVNFKLKGTLLINKKFVKVLIFANFNDEAYGCFCLELSETTPYSLKYYANYSYYSFVKLSQ